MSEHWPYHPVISLPKDAPVFDFSNGFLEGVVEKHRFGIGKYNERRPGIYTAPQFADRTIHMGVDLFAPKETPIHAFEDGKILHLADNSLPFDYGNTLVTEHLIEGVPLFVLWGHLNRKSIDGREAGQKFEKGDVIAWVGSPEENGGWAPHLHFQLSYERPLVPDMPGVISEKDRARLLLKYPDPRLVLGPIY